MRVVVNVALGNTVVCGGSAVGCESTVICRGLVTLLVTMVCGGNVVCCGSVTLALLVVCECSVELLVAVVSEVVLIPWKHHITPRIELSQQQLRWRQTSRGIPG